jgi:uncharacterized protein YbaR (Trm112 family)
MSADYIDICPKCKERQLRVDESNDIDETTRDDRYPTLLITFSCFCHGCNYKYEYNGTHLMDGNY